MSYCICGGYLGSGGVDGYAGRRCGCANPVEDRTPVITTNEITLPGGTYEISSTKILDSEAFSSIKITKVADLYLSIPKLSFWERLKYLFTGELKGVQIRVGEIK